MMERPYPPQLLDKVKSAPKQPGCYLFMDKQGFIIYVGKAKSLKSRVSSYFTRTSRQDERLEDLLPQITDVEFRTVNTELDALILEYQLIKRHKPWFNRAMKPDKVRPYLCICHDGPYPALYAAQEAAEDGCEYYDRFTDEEEIKAVLALLGNVWGIARCGLPSYAGVKAPCLYHSLGQCLAPCTGKADAKRYRQAVDEVRQLLRGEPVARAAELEAEMASSAAALDFERAQQYKDQLEGLRRVQYKARRFYHYPKDSRVLVLIRPHQETRFSMFFVVDGAVAGRANFEESPTPGQLEQCAEAWKAAAVCGEDERLLARCLTDISAYKTFVVLPEEFDAEALQKEIERFER